MKKIIIPLILILLTFNLKAQLNFGVYFGGNISYTTGIDSLQFSDANLNKLVKPGFNINMLFDFKTGYSKYIETGIMYAEQGVIFKAVTYQEFDNGMGIAKITRMHRNNLNYFKIPLIWKQTWGDWYTNLGIYGAIAPNLNARWSETDEFYDSVFIDTGKVEHFANGLSMFDLGFNLGAGIQLPLNNFYDFILGVSYNHGLLAINPNFTRKELAMYNRSFTVTIGIIVDNKGYKYKYRHR